jgi:hypothetical protein
MTYVLSWIFNHSCSIGQPKKMQEVKRRLRTAFNGIILVVGDQEPWEILPNVSGDPCMAQDRCRSTFETHWRCAGVTSGSMRYKSKSR